DEIVAIGNRAKEAGVIAHRFYGSEDQIMVIDEWPDEQSFQGFFDGVQAQVRPLLEQVGAPVEPPGRFWPRPHTPHQIRLGAERPEAPGPTSGPSSGYKATPASASTRATNGHLLAE